MTATPIPRTLAMTIYGDLDVSVIDELPPGRKPIVTLHKYDNQLTSLYQGIRKQIQQGRQAYIVFPVIKESEKKDLKDLESGFEALKEVFPDLQRAQRFGDGDPRRPTLRPLPAPSAPRARGTRRKAKFLHLGDEV